jgi:DNA anti-recombination protein RmuC
MRLREKNAYWNLKIQQNRHECKERNDKLLDEKNKIVKHYHELKRKMQQFREDEERRLGNLTTNSKRCMDKLRDMQKLAEKILKTAELCRKLETEKEKVLPFYQSELEGLDQEAQEQFMVERIDGVKKSKYNEF